MPSKTKTKKRFQIFVLLALPLALLMWIRSLHSWRPVTLMSYKNSAAVAAFSRDGKLLATCGSEADVSIWDVRQRRIVRVLSANPAHASHIAFSPDGRWLAASLDGFYNDEHGEVRLWDVQSGKLKRKWSDGRGMTDVAFSGDGKTVAGSGWSSVSLWDVENGKSKQNLGEGDDTWLSGVALSPDGRTAIGRTDRLRIIRWNVAKAAHSRDFYFPDKLTDGACMAFAPDGKTLAVGTSGRVIFYDARTWKVRQKLLFPLVLVTAIAFSPDGKFFAAGSDNAAEIKIWNLKTADLTRTLRGHSKTVTSLSFARDNETLASSSHDGTVRLWRLR